MKRLPLGLKMLNYMYPMFNHRKFNLKEVAMRYIGIDLHQQFSQVAVVEEDGKIVEEFKIANAPHMFCHPATLKLFSEPTKVALEACNGWYWLADELEGMGAEVHLAHPLKTKLIAEAKVKTDKIDARVLANLLRTNFLPESYLAPSEVREARELHRHRAALVRVRTSVKNRVHSILSKHGIYFLHISDIFGVGGRKNLQEASQRLRPVYQEALKRYLSLVDWLDIEIAKVQSQIDNAVVVSEAMKLLLTIPGIGKYSAYLVLSEIGNIERFSTPKKLVSYAGLNPGADISGKHSYSKHITKQGNAWLRWVLIQDAPHAVRCDERLKKLYRRISIRKGKNTAKVAIARELLTSIYWVLKKRQPYCPKSVTPVLTKVL
jgi:transposase